MERFKKIVGYEPVKEQLSMALDVMADPEKYRKLGVRLPNGVLLNGMPGVGKTLFAKEFIAESGRRAFTIKKNKPDGAFVDHIRETFTEAAKSAPSMVFLDDMDKFANEDCCHPDAEEYVAVQACIDDVKDKDVFVIATTNDMGSLPDSLRRSGRFDWIFTLNVPEAEDSEKIFSYYLENKRVDKDIDTMELARFARGYSCASLEKVVNDAGLHAGYEGRRLINQSDLIQSCLRTFYGMKSDKKPIPEWILRRVAIHEAGHVVISEFFSQGSVDFASISCHRSSRHGGLTMYMPDLEEKYLFEKTEKRIMIHLGGKAATEVVLGETDLGSKSDMHEVFDQVRSLIDGHTLYDFTSWSYAKDPSKFDDDIRDRITATEVSRYYNNVKQILISNRPFLDAVIEKLYEKKTISYKDIKEISDSYRTA